MKKVIVLFMMISVLPCYAMKRSMLEMTNDEIREYLIGKFKEAKKHAEANAQKLMLAGVQFFYPDTEISAAQLKHAQQHIEDVLDAVNAANNTTLQMHSIMPYVDQQEESGGRVLRFVQSIVESSYLPESSSQEERDEAIKQALQELENDKEQREYIYPGRRTKRQWQKDMKEIFSKVPHYKGLHVCSED